MIKNPIHLRLEKLSNQQLMLFMVCLCERMYPNFAFYCEQVNSQYNKIYKNILDLAWESLLVKKAKINFDHQLEKLEPIIPTVDEQSPYSIYPAIDACQALSELIHSYLSDELIEHALSISQISIKTIVELEMTKMDTAQLSEHEMATLPAILDELDLQWEVYRLIKNEKNDNLELIKGLKEDLREEQISNIGVFLSN